MTLQMDQIQSAGQTRTSLIEMQPSWNKIRLGKNPYTKKHAVVPSPVNKITYSDNNTLLAVSSITERTYFSHR